MAIQTGRTVAKWIDFIVMAFGGTLRSIPVNSINGVGLSYPEQDLTAFQDAIKGALSGTPDCQISITGPFDTTPVAAVGTLSGSHTVLASLVGGNTPCTIDIHVGMRHTWESGEPQFGITSTATSGFLCRTYDVNIDTMTYTATFSMFPGSSAPAWGTTVEA